VDPPVHVHVSGGGRAGASWCRGRLRGGAGGGGAAAALAARMLPSPASSAVLAALAPGTQPRRPAAGPASCPAAWRLPAWTTAGGGARLRWRRGCSSRRSAGRCWGGQGRSRAGGGVAGAAAAAERGLRSVAPMALAAMRVERFGSFHIRLVRHQPQPHYHQSPQKPPSCARWQLQPPARADWMMP
jgi:hypothetical protein